MLRFRDLSLFIVFVEGAWLGVGCGRHEVVEAPGNLKRTSAETSDDHQLIATGLSKIIVLKMFEISSVC